MKKQSGYMRRAMESRDPRFRNVLSKLGHTYERRDMVADAPVVTDIQSLRAEYERVVGRRPFMGWDEAALREKIAGAK